jgi:hypothetical protein
VLVGPRAGNPDTWAEKDGRSPTNAFSCFSGEFFILVNAILRRIESNG